MFWGPQAGVRGHGQARPAHPRLRSASHMQSGCNGNLIHARWRRRGAGAQQRLGHQVPSNGPLIIAHAARMRTFHSCCQSPSPSSSSTMIAARSFQAKAFRSGKTAAKPAARMSCKAYKVTLKTPSGEQTIECPEVGECGKPHRSTPKLGSFRARFAACRTPTSWTLLRRPASTCECAMRLPEGACGCNASRRPIAPDCARESLFFMPHKPFVLTVHSPLPPAGPTPAALVS